MEDRHPVSGRKLPSVIDSAATPEELEGLEPGHVERLNESDVPWLVFGPWTIYSMERPTDASLEALIVTLAQLVKLAAAEAAHAFAKTATRKLKEPDGFHELWIQAIGSETYDKSKWVAFQAELLRDVGLNARADDALAVSLENRDKRIAQLEGRLAEAENDARQKCRDFVIACDEDPDGEVGPLQAARNLLARVDELEKPDKTDPAGSEKPAKEAS